MPNPFKRQIRKALRLAPGVPERVWLAAAGRPVRRALLEALFGKERTDGA